MVDVAAIPTLHIGVDLHVVGGKGRAANGGGTQCMTHLKYLAEGGHNMVIVDEKVDLSDELFGKGRRPGYERVCDHLLEFTSQRCRKHVF